MKRKYRTHLRKVHTLDELRAEKIRLKAELRYTEEKISDEYHYIREALTLRNLLATAIHDIEVTSTVLSKAFSVGKSLFAKGKKKKKKHPETEAQEQTES